MCAGLEQALERAREAENAAAKKVAELQKTRNKLGIARARIIAAEKAREDSAKDKDRDSKGDSKTEPAGTLSALPSAASTTTAAAGGFTTASSTTPAAGTYAAIPPRERDRGPRTGSASTERKTVGASYV